MEEKEETFMHLKPYAFEEVRMRTSIKYKMHYTANLQYYRYQVSYTTHAVKMALLVNECPHLNTIFCTLY